eukprot:gene7337-9738_t
MGYSHGDNVTLSWSGVSNASNSDWIGAYLVNDDVQSTAPIKYQYASYDPQYLATGSGSFVFRLMNMRDDYVFYFFRNGIKSPIVAAKSNSVKVDNPNEPLQGRISLTNQTGEVKVSWTTKNRNVLIEPNFDAGVLFQFSSSPQVRWGFSSGSFEFTVSAYSYSYTAEDMCGPPATTIGYRSPGTFHSAIIKNLKPSQRVFYIFGDPQHGLSEEYSFRNVPLPGASVNVIAFGDLGQFAIDHSLQQEEQAPSRNTTNGIEAELNNTDLVLHIGDISCKWMDDSDQPLSVMPYKVVTNCADARGYTSQWEQFHDQLEPISTSVPYMTAIGNHERDWPGTGTTGDKDSGGECGVAYELRFPMPTPGRDLPWYSFDFGVLHVMVMSTEQDFAPGSPQHTYFMNDLAKINRTKTPWVIFSGHRPFYIDSTNWEPHGAFINTFDLEITPRNISKPIDVCGYLCTLLDRDQTVALQIRFAFEDILYENKIDLIFGAHHHSYQRSCHVYRSKCQESGDYLGPVVVNIGMAGATNSQNIEPIQPEIFKFVDDSHHGYTRIFANTTHFHMQYIRGDDRQVHDDFVLTK